MTCCFLLYRGDVVLKMSTPRWPRPERSAPFRLSTGRGRASIQVCLTARCQVTKHQWRRRSFQLLFGNWKLFHPVPLISRAVWARCCIACLVELNAALQQGSRFVKACQLAEAFPLPLRCSMRLGCRRRVWTRQAKDFNRPSCCVFALRVSFEGFGLRGLLERRTAPVSVQGCFRVLVGTSEVGSRESVRGSLSAVVVRGFWNAISVQSTDLCCVGSCSCSGVDFVCVSGPKTSPGNPNGGPCSRRSRISDCVVCRKDGYWVVKI